MNIGDVLKAADSLYPNHFDIREKLGWCSEVSQTIRNEVNKRYDFVRTSPDSLMEEINKIGIDRVQSVMTRDRIFRKANVRSWYCDENHILPDDVKGEIRIVYLISAKPFRCSKYSGEITLKNGYIVFDEPHTFEEGDVIIIQIPGRDDAETQITSVQSSVGIADTDIAQYMGEAVITKKLCDALESEAPYDYMYVDYLIGKMCFYQNDIDAYNRHITQYNNKMALYQRFIKARDAYSNDAPLRGMWL